MQVTASLRTLAARPVTAGSDQGALALRESTVSCVSAAATPLPPEPFVRPARGPPAANADSPEVARRLVEDHDRIADGLNDTVVHRIFSAGLDLAAALGLIGEHRAAGRIEHAVSELDLAISDIRDLVFDHQPSRRAPVSHAREPDRGDGEPAGCQEPAGAEHPPTSAP
jgi:hypothetical protein